MALTLQRFKYVVREVHFASLSWKCFKTPETSVLRLNSWQTFYFSLNTRFDAWLWLTMFFFGNRRRLVNWPLNWLCHEWMCLGCSLINHGVGCVSDS